MTLRLLGSTTPLQRAIFVGRVGPRG